MTSSDLSGAYKPWKCQYRVNTFSTQKISIYQFSHHKCFFFVFDFKKLSNLVSSEFFNEGDLEKEKFKVEPAVNTFFFKQNI